jgi:hypothetical protein
MLKSQVEREEAASIDVVPYKLLLLGVYIFSPPFVPCRRFSGG